MPRKAPAIVECPKGAYLMLFYVIKKHGKIYVAIVQIVKVYHVGGEIGYGFEELFSFPIGKATVISGNS